MKKILFLIVACLTAAQILFAQSQSFSVGAKYGGGVIIYIEPGGTWGVIAAEVDVPKPTPNSLPRFTYSEAEAACRNWVYNKKGDWYLPSEEELSYMVPFRNNGLNLSGFAYWSTSPFNPYPTYPVDPNIKYVKFFGNPTFNLGVHVSKSQSDDGQLFYKARAVRRFYLPLTSQGVESACLPASSGGGLVPGPANFTYGSAIDMRNSSRRMNISIGEMAAGQARQGDDYSAAFGSISGFLLAPFAPIVKASQGELLDRIQISWEPNPLGPLPTDGYKLYRDGVFLGSFDNKVRNFNDFNVIAGRPYKYEVLGINVYGDGERGAALGFQVPNGVVTGYVQTLNNSPVPDAVITLMPMQGFSAYFSAHDLAFAKDTAGFLKNANNWTLSLWLQTDAATLDSNIFHLAGAQWSLVPILSSSMHEGVVLKVTGQTSLQIPFPDSTKNGWHHLAITHDGDQFRAYLNGVLVGNIMAQAVSGAAQTLNLGGEGSQWAGRIDELRIYHRRLDELDLGEVMEGTASSLTPGLKYYWKMDEELGTKSFDLLKRNQLYFCGPAFDKSRPPVRTAGKTDSDGYYRIESANYGTGTTFIATPSKLFYMHRALKFVRGEQDFATLPNFGLAGETDTAQLKAATLELILNSAGPDGNQCLLHKKWAGSEFKLSLSPSGNTNDLKCTFGGSTQTIGTLGMGYQHLALTFWKTGNNLEVETYKNGAPFGAKLSFSGITGNLSDSTQQWLVGACWNGTGKSDYFGGLIDELAVYDTLISPTDIQSHATQTRDTRARHLRIYFPFDEGAGNQLNNSGALLTGPGTSSGTDWTPFAANQMTEPHEFSPKTRQVTLNPSVTSVDQVDFTDRSTVAVSGYVRYKNTDCFAKNVEILVNGTSFNPPIFTDSTGYFIADFEPGVTATLTPKLEDHKFLPASWQVINVNSPIAGILFNDITTRKITGVIAGGHCHKSIISGTADDCRIKVRTRDGCYEKEMLVSATTGDYAFEGLPPTELTIAITKHNNFRIYTDFQTQGGRTIDLAKKDSSDVDFIYIAPPQVLVEGFEPFIQKNCSPDSIVIPQWDMVELTIKVFEQYGAGQDPANQCPLDSASLSINNTFDHDYDFTTPLDTFYRGGKFVYRFAADRPNVLEPYTRIIEITADDQGRKSTPYSNKAIITGTVVGEAKFTTQLPIMPSYILRDPPGDGSYAYLAKDTKVCNTMHLGEELRVVKAFESEYTRGTHTEITLPFVGTHLEFETEFINNKVFTTTITTKGTQKWEYCVTNREVLTTDAGELVVGGATLLNTTSMDTLAGNDLYVGVGFNVILSDSKEVFFKDCKPGVKKITAVQPDTFVTNYKYSEWNIEHNVIRYLDTLIQNKLDSAVNAESKQRWEQYIALNKSLKKAAKYQQNISFDAGVQYEAAMTIDDRFEWDIETILDLQSQNEAFYEVKIIKPVTAGFTIDSKITLGGAGAVGGGGSKGTTVTTGYVLKDNDPGDTWTLDVKADPMFKTPVFDVKAGQSSCPWEVGTAHRDGIQMTTVDGTKRTGVPSNGVATFHFLLGNKSSTYETRTYYLTTGPESNPDGAVIRVNGSILDRNIAYAIPYNTTLPVTITVERGPQAYSYKGLEVVLFSACHDDRCLALGVEPDFETYLYSANYLDVDFLEPCSEVDIAFPFDGWVIKSDTIGNPDILPITVYNYDVADPDLLGVRVQYRPVNGDGAWINITDGTPDYVPKANLGSAYTQVDWNTGGNTKLADGSYEIRALTVCGNGPGTNPGYSHVREGRIERQPPSIVGVPQPSDGVLNVGDEISVTFNKQLNCSKIFKADLSNPRNVGLFNSVTNELVDFELSCFENKIELVPKFQNKFLENKVLRLELHNIPDKTGNTLEQFDWEFFVDRNELAWLTDSVGITKTEGETKTATASIQNRGGSPLPFTITGAPAWVRVVPDKGTLVPNEIRPIRFEVDSSLAFGLWKDTVTLHTETGANPFFMGGDEALPVGVRVVCRPPSWDLDAGIHPVTMNMVVSLNVQGVLSTDEEDIVAAFIDGELRGRARIQYFPSVNKYLAHLTIFGESVEVTKPIALQIWDASACLRYSTVLDSTFQPDNVVGTPVNPQVLHTNSLVLREIPLNNGWNWVSFNLAFPNTMLDPALASLKHPDNGLIKDQNNFSMYSSGWFGSLTDLGNTSMYQYRASQPDTLNMMGDVIDPTSVSIPLGSGWNWLGYLPNYSLPVDAALGSLTAATGDLIKGQYGFSQFVATYGWIGNLKFMYPPQGYQLRLTSPGALTYPPNTGNRPTAVEDRGEGELLTSYWQLDPTKYEHSMTLVGMLASSGQNTTLAEHELGAFVGNELRGAAKAIYVAPLNAYLFFLTTYANTTGEQIKFKLYHATTGQISPLSETMFFAPDLHQGTIQAPVPFSLPVSGAYETVVTQSLEVQPNPFTNVTSVRFGVARDQAVQLSITDLQGREIQHFRLDARQGLNTWTWQPEVGAGVYFIRLQTAEGTAVRKVIKS